MNLKFTFALLGLACCSTASNTFRYDNNTIFTIWAFEDPASKEKPSSKEEPTFTKEPTFTETLPPDEKSQESLLKFIDCCKRIPTGPNSSIQVQYTYGGTPTEFGEFPSLVLLHYVDSNGKSHFPCGGTLINKRYILTAAHCVVGNVSKKYGTLTSIRLGEHDWSNTVCKGGTCNNQVLEMRIESVLHHELYRPEHKMHDIALVRLSEPLQYYRSHIKPICLRWMNQYLSSKSWDGHNFTVVGWGRTLQVKKSPVSNKLRIPYYDHTECKNRYARLRHPINGQQICAGGEFKRDSCDGDSGGPLISTVDGCDYLDGIVSYGKGCGLENWPGIYTNVTAYQDWIMQNLLP